MMHHSSTFRKGDPGRYTVPMAAEGGFIPSLNGMRALSILLVFLSHTVSNKIFPGGFGVRIFFVISGFLITRLLFVELKAYGKIDLAQFYIRRLLRLYPVIVCFTVVVVAASAIWWPSRLHLIEILSGLFYFANYYYSRLSETGQTGEIMPFIIFWSLSVEEHFYIFFPLIFALFRKSLSNLIGFCLFLCGLCLSLRIFGALSRPELLHTKVFYFETQYQIDAIVYGVLVAVLCELARGRALLRTLCHPAIPLAALALIGLCFAYRDLFFRETVRYSFLSLSIAVLMTNVLFSPGLDLAKRVLNLPILEYVGRLSYSIYLWHYAIVSLIGLPMLSKWVGVPLIALMTALVSMASYHLIEQPVAALRHRHKSVAPREAI
ncbi:acyltransferase family protein [Methylobacterium sp. Leaf104]|uniref:acyltransferase family protein n=2 Tax=Methylobacterium TaxID=407 RepID=UPI0009E92D90